MDGENVRRERPIDAAERSGVLHPARLGRFAAHWFEPAAEVTAVADRYWHVRWDLGDEGVDQAVIDLPVVTVTIESGDVPAPFVATGLQSRAWSRRIAGEGDVFAIRLRPAGLRVVSDLTPQQLLDAAVPVTPQLDPRLHGALTEVARETTPAGRARASDAMLARLMAERPLGPDQVLANAVVELLVAGPRGRATAALADELGVGERTMQRALAATLGRGPKWVARRVRLQEVARALAVEDDDLSGLALELGYTDQAHLTSDFRVTSGLTPAAYRRSLRTMADATRSP